ncbi:hypothetical protein EIP91_000691 [Steccherinum ochraceum]|uniref:Uncharacterized protein n=1 Tax=Steccherinum ochraceum TaxID=92696 RepID=A0A4R0RIN2_9APHY|nr:hypothetical protein EIP91_000691 [Steccherinum ochraceum]
MNNPSPAAVFVFNNPWTDEDTMVTGNELAMFFQACKEAREDAALKKLGFEPLTEAERAFDDYLNASRDAKRRRFKPHDALMEKRLRRRFPDLPTEGDKEIQKFIVTVYGSDWEEKYGPRYTQGGKTLRRERRRIGPRRSATENKPTLTTESSAVTDIFTPGSLEARPANPVSMSTQDRGVRSSLLKSKKKTPLKVLSKIAMIIPFIRRGSKKTKSSQPRRSL